MSYKKLTIAAYFYCNGNVEDYEHNKALVFNFKLKCSHFAIPMWCIVSVL